MYLDVSKEDAESILNHPDIYKTICDDGSPEVLVIPEGWINVVTYIDVPVGCFILHRLNSVTMECHVQILPEYRDFSLEMSELMLDWARENVDAMKFIAWIPIDCENVKMFAEKMGFAVEGLSEGSIMKDGQLVSQWLMGFKLWA